MQLMKNNAADDTSVQSDNRNDSYNSIISNLGSLIEQVRASMKLIESAITPRSIARRSGSGCQHCRAGRCHAALCEGERRAECLQRGPWRSPSSAGGYQVTKAGNSGARGPAGLFDVL